MDIMLMALKLNSDVSLPEDIDTILQKIKMDLVDPAGDLAAIPESPHYDNERSGPALATYRDSA